MTSPTSRSQSPKPLRGRSGATHRALRLGLGTAAAGLAMPAAALAAAFAGASVPSQTDKASGSGVVPISVSCPTGTSGSCGGTLSLRTAKKVSGKIQSLGSASFTITSGSSAKVRVKLNAEGRKLLKHGKITPVATASSHDGAGHTAKQSRKITVKKAGSGPTSPGGFY